MNEWMNEETETQGGWQASSRPHVQLVPKSGLWFSQPLIVDALQFLKLAYSTWEVCLGDKWGDAKGLALCFGVGECFAFLGQAMFQRPPPPPQESLSGSERCGHPLLIQHGTLSVHDILKALSKDNYACLIASLKNWAEAIPGTLMAFIISKNFQTRRFHHFPAGLWAQQHCTGIFFPVPCGGDFITNAIFFRTLLGQFSLLFSTIKTRSVTKHWEGERKWKI